MGRERGGLSAGAGARHNRDDDHRGDDSRQHDDTADDTHARHGNLRELTY